MVQPCWFIHLSRQVYLRDPTEKYNPYPAIIQAFFSQLFFTGHITGLVEKLIPFPSFTVDFFPSMSHCVVMYILQATMEGMLMRYLSYSWFFVVIIVICGLFPPWLVAETVHAGIRRQVKGSVVMTGKPNHLINEKSPYLLQHAYNPVDWYPWGDEPFARARKEDKPIFLSIGYSTCHWCHVMAHESFENKEIAALLNRYFICIKVDREERPDVDQMYMAATMAMNGSGGWPMSVFLFPDGRPFYAATYIPAKGMYGRPGFPEIIEAVHKAWQGRRDELQQTAGRLIRSLKEQGRVSAAGITADIDDRAFSELSAEYDAVYGGFGGAPKFPRPVVFNFLLGYYWKTGNKHALAMTTATLTAMAAGGMYDQLGGGFHRYSVDGQWRIPHFEKMLYDQAQLLHSYLDAYQITGDSRYAGVAREIADYVLRDMRDSRGGFYSAEDADSEDPYSPGSHGEGAFYLWTEKDIVTTLGAKAANIFNFCYGVEFDGNALQDPQHEFTGRNILYRAKSDEEAAAHFSMSVADVEASLARSRKILLARRATRVRPHRDDKIITAWNGLMIGALAEAGAILDEPKMTDAAYRAAMFIRDTLYDPASKSLKRRYRDGEAAHAGQLDDYTFLVAGLLDLYQVRQDPQLLSWAMDLTTQSIKLFRDEKQGGFFDSVVDARVPIRMKSDYDGAEPAANSMAAMNLIRLGRMTANADWLARAQKTVTAFAERINHVPRAVPQMLCAVMLLREKPEQVVITGRKTDTDTQSMLAEVWRHFNPNRVVLLADGGDNQKMLAKMLPFMQTVTGKDGRATAYVCRDFTCRLPVTSVGELAHRLTGAGRKK